MKNLLLKCKNQVLVGSAMASSVAGVVVAHAEGFTVDMNTTFTPILTSVTGQVVSFITSMVPFIVGVALLGAGVTLVKKLIATGTKSIG